MTTPTTPAPLADTLADPLAPRARARAVPPDVVDALTAAIAHEARAVENRVKLNLERHPTYRRRNTADEKVRHARVATAHAYRRLVEAHADVHQGAVAPLASALAAAHTRAAGWTNEHTRPIPALDPPATPPAGTTPAGTTGTTPAPDAAKPDPFRVPARWIVPGDVLASIDAVVLAVDVGGVEPDTVTVTVDASAPSLAPTAQVDAYLADPPTPETATTDPFTTDATVPARASGPVQARFFYGLSEFVSVIRPKITIPMRWLEPGDVVLEPWSPIVSRVVAVKTGVADSQDGSIDLTGASWPKATPTDPWTRDVVTANTARSGWAYSVVDVYRHATRLAPSLAEITARVGSLELIHARIDRAVAHKVRAKREAERAKREEKATTVAISALSSLTVPPEPVDTDADRAARRQAARAALAG